ncbi:MULTISPECIES: hypothetical protein [Pseudonocardia]|uniref:Uncharacterized protein n=2 Tax=Pseudonocardia TaxID=1847 RepID=A0A1Y2MW61_PSEAH|nr:MULTISPECIES: hypothetical protein [Pseudonocardia]OSY39047.1 hypothetical protein BG845_03616 [Pseudonocardia autotrophica]BBG02032.1 hypothetical protein Pdca_32410 [Pseudonocardia autotrophica]GEC23195.1 hypothetical protein PSA01_02240 [Pseudonocardia saturnea]
MLFGPDLAARHEEWARLFVTLFARRQQEPDDLVASFAVGGLARVLGNWLSGDLALPRDELVDRCTGLLLAVQRSRV